MAISQTISPSLSLSLSLSPNHHSITSVKLRIKAFHENTEPLLASLDARGLTKIVTSEQEPAKVYRTVRQQFLPKIAFVLGEADGAGEEKRAAVAAATGCESLGGCCHCWVLLGFGLDYLLSNID